jgi:hypothetical protein
MTLVINGHVLICVQTLFAEMENVHWSASLFLLQFKGFEHEGANLVSLPLYFQCIELSK